MASPFASLVVSDEIALPFDEGQWIKVRKLTGRQYEEAQDAGRAGFLNGNKWARAFRESLDKGHTEAVQKALEDPLTGFDRHTLARLGLTAWSYERPIDPAAIDDLDDDAIEFIAREVLKLTKPSLFQTADEQEHERKNAIGSSTEA
jgi:hypothetical protein